MVEQTGNAVPEGDLRRQILKAVARHRDKSEYTSLETPGLFFVRFQGTSMQPGLREGDILVAAPIGDARPCKGHIVLRPRGGGVFEAHRVIRWMETPPAVITRGDSRPFRDRPWPPDHCGGVVVAVWRGNALMRPPERPSAEVRIRTLGAMLWRALFRRFSMYNTGVRS